MIWTYNKKGPKLHLKSSIQIDSVRRERPEGKIRMKLGEELLTPSSKNIGKA